MIKMVSHTVVALCPILEAVFPIVARVARPTAKALTVLSDQCSFTDTDTPSSYIVHRVMHTAMVRLCSALAFASVFGTALGGKKIDTHFHALPPAYVDTLKAAGGDPSGYDTPDWALEAAVSSMNTVGTSVGKLPPVSFLLSSMLTLGARNSISLHSGCSDLRNRRRCQETRADFK